MDLSIVIPLYNEQESLPELHDWIKRVVDAAGFSYEIIFVDDGSTDDSWSVIQKLASKAKALPSTTVFSKPLATWSSPWMPTCRIRLTRFQNSTA